MVEEEMGADMGVVEEERESEDVERGLVKCEYFLGGEVELGLGLEEERSFLGHLSSDVLSFLNRLLMLSEDLFFFFFTFSVSSGFNEVLRRIERSFCFSLLSYSESFFFGLLGFCKDFLLDVLLELSVELGRELEFPGLVLKSEELGLRAEIEFFIVEV